MKLNLGCGKKHLAGYVNVDVKAPCDKVVNLDQYPWPWPDASVDEIYCSHFLEHLDDAVRGIRECHRILKPNAALVVVAPYYASQGAYADLTHKHFFALRSFDYFPEFRITGKKLVFPKVLWPVGIAANSAQRIYEDFFAGWFPAREVRFTVVKT